MLFAGGVCAEPAHAEPPPPPVHSAGMPLLQNFKPETYSGYPQNWAVVQDHRGVIYVANGEDGVLEFDGTLWRHIAVPNQGMVRSLAVDAQGRVYVGCVGEFGYLAPDALGRLRYVSLLDRLAPADREFADVWNILPGDEGVYFATADRLFRLASGKIRVWNARTQFHLAFYVDHQLYIEEIGRGLEKLEADQLTLVEGGERFANDKIYAMVPWSGTEGDQSVLIASRRAGWLIFDGHGYRPWATRDPDALKAALVYGARWLANGNLAVATLQGGVVLLDREGNVVDHIGTPQGLIGDTVYDLFQDRNGALWLALDNGIARVEAGSALTYFNRSNGLDGSVMAIHRHDGSLYVGTAKGLFRLDATESAQFSRVEGIHGQVWDMLDLDQSMFVAGAAGVLELDGKGALRQRSNEFTFAMLRPAPDAARILMARRGHLVSVRLDRGQFVDERMVPGVKDEVHALLAEGDGTVWAGFVDVGVARVPPLDSSPRSVKAQRLESPAARKGGPGFVSLGRIDGSPRFGTVSNILRFDPRTRALVPDERFAALFDSDSRQVQEFDQDAVGSVWMFTVDPVRSRKAVEVAVADARGHYHWDLRPLQALSGKTVLTMVCEADGVTWIGTSDGLYRYDARVQSVPARPAPTLLRQVSTSGGHVLWGGSGPTSSPELQWKDNSVRFDYAQPGMELGGTQRFQVMLEGLDSTWSRWSGESYRDYTNLHEGVYRFRVRSGDAYGNLGREATFLFRVLPPWYRTWWAYLLWTALLALAVAGTMRWRLRTLHERNRELARLVSERTEALEQANSALVDQTITDALTGLRNRRYVVDHLEKDIALVQRNHRQLALGYADHADANINLLFLMMDLDHFKGVNDRYGHAAGDRVLAQLRDILVAATRETDTPVRWGGEEFLVVARFASMQFGPVVAERIRSMVAQHPFDLGNDTTIHLTCSIGFASYPVFAAALHKFGWEDVVNLADQCLYRAKHAGRNRWVGVMPTNKAATLVVPETLPVDLDVLVADGYLDLRLHASRTVAS